MEIMEQFKKYEKLLNETIKTIIMRRSVRKFAEREIEKEKIDLIIDATMRAPTAGNMMLYSIINITSQEIKDKLVKTCDNQPFIAKAPLVLLFLADFNKWFELFNASDVESIAEKLNLKNRKPDVGDLFIAICDALIAAQTSVIVAESLGIGSCYIGDILENYETHKEIFNLPDYVFPITLVVYGYPAMNYNKLPFSPRFSKDYILFENKYKKFDKNEILKMVEPLKEKYFKNFNFAGEIKNIGQLYFKRKYASNFSLEMSRSVKVALKNWLNNEQS